MKKKSRFKTENGRGLSCPEMDRYLSEFLELQEFMADRRLGHAKGIALYNREGSKDYITAETFKEYIELKYN